MTTDHTSPYGPIDPSSTATGTNPYAPAYQAPVDHPSPAAVSPTTARTTDALPRAARVKALVRTIGTLVIAVLAVVSFFLAGPNDFTSQHSAERSEFASAHAANEDLTSGAPQQAVVNGWTANDLLGLISRQLDDGSGGDQRPAILLTLGIVLVALRTVTEPSSAAGRAPAPTGRH
jgi:hypothetical protein